jgi:serine/threonine protein kinase/tetratricopeptide (TPR) repeat protein
MPVSATEAGVNPWRTKRMIHQKDGGQVGKTISHYKVVRKLGEGGMGEVYLAQDTKLDRQVALKFLCEQFASDRSFKARFKREARAAAALNHPNIITIHEVAEHEDRPFIAMEFVEGQSLKELIAGKDLSIDKVTDLGIQISQGLAKAHQAGIVHRDVKPQNILIDKDGRARICDFGLAKLKREVMLTKTGTTVGTVSYMSPEQGQGKEVDQRSDIFSLGVVLYEMVTGQLPFKGEHEAAIVYSIVNEAAEPLARYKADVPEELQRIVDKALRKDPQTRYQSAADMVADLKEVQRESATTGTLSARSAFRVPQKGRLRVVAIIGAILIAAVAVMALLLLSSRTDLPVPPGAEMAARTGWKNSIAVLPFRDFSPEGDQEYFCDGMTDAIIGKLSGLENLKVISMSSVMRFRDPNRDIKEIGRELGVAAVLEGSIQKEDSRIRLGAQLVNVADGAHLWSDRYDRELESVFAIQDEISQAIVDVLKIRLLGDDRTAFAKRHTENLEAYNAYAQGRFLWNKRTEEHLMRAIEYFERAVKLDPNYALAYAGLADAYSVLPSNVGTPVEEVLPKAKEAARKALELDDKLGEAHASMGLALKLEKDMSGAEKEYLQAIQLNPAYAYAHYWYAMLLGEMGRGEESRKELETAFELDPLSVVILVYLADTKWESGDSLEAAELMERALEIEPTRVATYWAFGGGLRRAGRLEDAVRVYKRAIEIDSTYRGAHNQLCYTYNEMGDFEKALEAADNYVRSLPNEPDAYDTRGDIYAYNGRLNQAIENYRKALEVDPEFTNSLRNLFGAYLFKREYEKAESLVREALLSNEQQVRTAARTYMAFIPMFQGRLNQALAVLDEGIAADESDREPGSDLAYKHLVKFLIYMETERFDLARKELEIVRAFQEKYLPKDPTRMRDMYAVFSALEGQYGQADELLQTWRADIDENNEEQMIHYSQIAGIVELIKGNPQAAIDHLRNGLYDGFTPLFEIRYFLALAYLESDQAEQAAEILERALLRYDKNRMESPMWSVKAHFYLGQAYERLGRTQDAVDQYEEFLEWWKDADPGIVEVEDAKGRLEELRAGG